MDKDDAPNPIQRLLYAAFRKKIRTLNEVRDFAESNKIPFNTVKDYFYKAGVAGISTINQILMKLYHLDENRVLEILEMIEKTEPVLESRKIWNSIEADEERRIYYATVAKAIWEIERDLNKKK